MHISKENIGKSVFSFSVEQMFKPFNIEKTAFWGKCLQALLLWPCQVFI